MKTEAINSGWTLSGKIIGAGQAIYRGSLALPFSLSNYEELCGRDGLFLRQWTLTNFIEKPEERKISLSERWFLTLDGIEGKGTLKIGEEAQDLSSHMEVELTKQMREGDCPVALVFPPHLPRLYPGETGEDLPVSVGVVSASVRSVYFLHLLSLDVVDGNAEVTMEAFGAGRVQVKLRLLYGDELLWYENVEMNVTVGENVLKCPISKEVPNGAALKVLVERGGEGCDEGERVVCGELPAPSVFFHFRKAPTDAVLRMLAGGGGRTAALHNTGSTVLEAKCRSLGLRLLPLPEELAVKPMFRQEDYNGDTCPLGSEDILVRYILSRRERGLPIHLYAMGRQKDDYNGLFSSDGEPLPCFAGVRAALASVYVTAQIDKPCCIPGTTICIYIDLYQEGYEGQVLRVEAYLKGEDGKTLKAGFFTICAKENRQSVGMLTTLIPWSLTGELTLCLQVTRQDESLCENKIKIPLSIGGTWLSDYEN